MRKWPINKQNSGDSKLKSGEGGNCTWRYTDTQWQSLIIKRADAEKQNMRLTTWKDASRGKIQKFDVVIANNYLTEFKITT